MCTEDLVTKHKQVREQTGIISNFIAQCSEVSSFLQILLKIGESFSHGGGRSQARSIIKNLGGGGGGRGFQGISIWGKGRQLVGISIRGEGGD